MAEQKGTPTSLGKNSPFRDRTVEENQKIFEEMKNGNHDEGVHVLRAKIDMRSGNLNMRDPVIYRIKKTKHHRSTWHIGKPYHNCSKTSSKGCNETKNENFSNYGTSRCGENNLGQ